MRAFVAEESSEDTR